MLDLALGPIPRLQVTRHAHIVVQRRLPDQLAILQRQAGAAARRLQRRSRELRDIRLERMESERVLQPVGKAIALGVGIGPGDQRIPGIGSELRRLPLLEGSHRGCEREARIRGSPGEGQVFVDRRAIEIREVAAARGKGDHLKAVACARMKAVDSGHAERAVQRRGASAPPRSSPITMREVRRGSATAHRSPEGSTIAGRADADRRSRDASHRR